MKRALIVRKFAFCFAAGLLPLLVGSCKKTSDRPPTKTTSEITDIAEPVTEAGWLKFKPEAKVNPRTLFADHAAVFHLPEGNEMIMRSEPETDEVGLTHFRYQQLFRKIEVENAEFLVREKDEIALSANGRLAYDFQPETTAPQIPEERAWEIVHERIPAERYFREDKLVDDLTNDSAQAAQPPYRPKGELLFTEDPVATGGERRLAWMFKVYVRPTDKARQIYINALTGAVLKERPLFPNCYLGSGPVTFRGMRNMNTQKKDDRFYLADDCDGNLLSAVLLDAASKRVDISDDDNNWAGNNPSVVTSYWGLRASYDYFWLLHGRRSYDGKNGNMTIFNDPTMNNAGRNANGGSGAIHIGLSGAGDNDDYNTLDIVGHEFTHSVIEQTAGLINDTSGDSGPLNESFCDIFGQMIEQWIEGGTQKEWVIGDDKGCAPPDICRDLLNPKTFNGPDTYKGLNFQPPGVDQHINTGVQNRWFALLCDGGAGTNAELGSAYNVGGIGMAKGRKIAYRNLARYLTPTSAYPDARAGSISAASDLYGRDSREVQSVDNAWCAVGLCSYVIPTKADIFDQPNGNPNPASPNNNNSSAGATPLGTVSVVATRFGGRGIPWSSGNQPTLKVTNLSIYPANDVDYFSITFPQVNAPGGRCFNSGFSFNFGTPVNVRIFINGTVVQTFANTSSFSRTFGGPTTEPIVMEVTAPFPGQILTYNLSIAFYLHYKSDCFQPDRPNKWDEIKGCPMCDLQILNGIDRVILEAPYRQPDKVVAQDHYFQWNGEGALEVPVSVLQGNNLHAELVNEAGRTISAADGQSGGDMLIHAAQAPPGVYSLRFSGFGNGTEAVVRTPR